MKEIHSLILAVTMLMITSKVVGQVTVEGYTYETNNRGYLNLVEINITDVESGQSLPVLFSNLDGFFKLSLPFNKSYKLTAKKDLFFDAELHFNSTHNEKVFLKIEMERKPGYIFDLTIAKPKVNPNATVDAIMDADIEIYNNTTNKEEIVWLAHHEPHFKYTFEKGNHYTLLIRKAGYVGKRVEVFVNVNGCILCVDGLGDLHPGVTDNLTSGFEMGTMLANIEMDSIEQNKTFTFKNIYYDYNSAIISPKAIKELKKVSHLMQQNPELILELGSHTDSRGKDSYNYELSEKRAAAAVDYLIKNGGIDASSLKSKGYGESKILNKCINGVECTDTEHAVNRRTELKILGIKQLGGVDRKSLAQIKHEEQTEQLIKSLQEQTIFEVKDTSMTSGQSMGFTGVRIELLINELALSAGHEIFKIFKPVYHLELANTKHAYYLGSFKTALEANEVLLSKKIKLKYPKARLVQFENGQIKE